MPYARSLTCGRGPTCPSGPVGYFWDVPDLATPKIDCAEVREKCCGFLSQPPPD